MVPITFGHGKLRFAGHRWIELAIALIVFAFVLLALCSPAH